MKFLFHLMSLTLISLSVMAQTEAINFFGKINNNKELSVIHISNIDGFKLPVPVKADGSFSLKTTAIAKGFYEVDEIGTVYLSPGFKLKVLPSDSTEYVFSGNGSVENNALRDARKSFADFVPMNEKKELEQAAYYTEVPDFLKQLQTFQQHGEQLFSKSKDAFFRKHAALDLEFFTKGYLWLYSIYYGKDMKKMDEFYVFVEKADRSDANFAKKWDSIYKATSVKKMDSVGKEELEAVLYHNWDKNDEILFRNSSAYRGAFSSYFSSMSNTPKYRIPVEGYDPVVKQVESLNVAFGEISNAYIREYFSYSITSNILKMTKDTAILNKHYNAYLVNATRADHKAEINDIYNNALTFVDNAKAPVFTYKDVTGKTVSLESLRGKFVYIDVWATWCTPCKAEIPHLQKVEADYHDKNIEFVSISVDVEKDWGKWEKYVNENQLKGIQLVADKAFNSEFVKKMNINSIPRFILIDPSGKLVAANALRPSDKKLRELLDKLL